MGLEDGPRSTLYHHHFQNRLLQVMPAFSTYLPLTGQAQVCPTFYLVLGPLRLPQKNLMI